MLANSVVMDDSKAVGIAEAVVAALDHGGVMVLVISCFDVDDGAGPESARDRSQ